MKALRTIEDKDLAKVSGGGIGGLRFRSKVGSLGLKPVPTGDRPLRDPRTSAFHPSWQEYGL